MVADVTRFRRFFMIWALGQCKRRLTYQSAIFLTVLDGNRENVTVLECVSASGRAIPPMVIVKGQEVKKTWECKPKIPGAVT